ncbi:hypothetical protein C8Q80DRAFT_1270007 [Daedaleopsis nitida]|nr:hypothetical protein C8Q80DRAFT_1270007 [Daedaleopsis nitida]
MSKTIKRFFRTRFPLSTRSRERHIGEWGREGAPAGSAHTRASSDQSTEALSDYEEMISLSSNINEDYSDCPDDADVVYDPDVDALYHCTTRAAPHFHAPYTPSQAYPTIALPFDLWFEIIHHVYDKQDLHAIGRVCRALHGLVKRALNYHTVVLESSGDILRFCDTIANTPAITALIRKLSVRCTKMASEKADATPTHLSVVLGSLSYVQSLSLLIDDPELAAAYVDEGLFARARFCNLQTFCTSLPCTVELLAFLRTHARNIKDLSLIDSDFGTDSDLDSEDESWLGPPFPSLRTLSCNAHALPYLTWSHALTHLRIAMQTSEVFTTVSATLGPPLVSLHVDVADWEDPPGIQQAAGDLLTEFENLRYYQTTMPEPNLDLGPLDWRRNRYPFLECFRQVLDVTIAWVVVAPSMLESDNCFEETALIVLSNWTPYVSRIMYGIGGVSHTSLYSSLDGNRLLRLMDQTLPSELLTGILAHVCTHHRTCMTDPAALLAVDCVAPGEEMGDASRTCRFVTSWMRLMITLQELATAAPSQIHIRRTIRTYSAQSPSDLLTNFENLHYFQTTMPDANLNLGPLDGRRNLYPFVECFRRVLDVTIARIVNTPSMLDSDN